MGEGVMPPHPRALSPLAPLSVFLDAGHQPECPFMELTAWPVGFQDKKHSPYTQGRKDTRKGAKGKEPDPSSFLGNWGQVNDNRNF